MVDAAVSQARPGVSMRMVLSWLIKEVPLRSGPGKPPAAPRAAGPP
ncbi:hypothetical protein [Nonomuraea sp. NPDC049646]